VSFTDTDLLGLRRICPEASFLCETKKQYVHLPVLKVPISGVTTDIEGLLCPGEHSGYPTRLFLSQKVPGKGQNWTDHTILGKTWRTWSWKDVPASLSLTEILLGHLTALR
jgi:hypothetical protein